MAALISGGEVINLHVGGAGANTAAAFWQLVAKEHHLVTSHHVKKARKLLRENEAQQQPQRRHDKARLRQHLRATAHYDNIPQQPAVECTQNLAPFFDEVVQRYVPRAVFVDCDPSAKYGGLFEPFSPLRHFFRPENFLFGTSGSRGLRSCAIADSTSLVRQGINALVREMERCDFVQGIQMTHHLGGGTGSGMGCFLAQTLKDELGSHIPLCPMTCLPSAIDVGGRNHALEVYNSMLSLTDLAESTALTYLIDNEALFDICFRLIGLSEPGWRDLNHIAATVLSDFTSCMRFPVSDGPTHHRLHFAEIPSILGSRSSLRFAVPGFTPLTNRASNAPMGALLSSSSSDGETPSHRTRLRYRRAGTRMPTVAEMTQALFRPSHNFASCDTLGHPYLSALTVFRGNISPEAIKQEVNYAQTSRQERHREWSCWMPENVTCRLCPQSQTNVRLSASWAGNTTAVTTAFERLLHQFEAQFTRKAFVHAYTTHGMDEQEFSICSEAVRTLISQYRDAFQEHIASRITDLQALKDLGRLPIHLDLQTAPHVMFDVNKPVQLHFEL